MYEILEIVLKKILNVLWVIGWTGLDNIGDFILLLVFNNSVEHFIKTVDCELDDQKL